MARLGEDVFQSTRGSLTPDGLKQKMDALVTDLNQALDESQLNSNHRGRRTLKRRSAGVSTICTRISSDASSSSEGGNLDIRQERKTSIAFSDSDDDISPSTESVVNFPPRLVHSRIPTNLVESDSVNENISPARLHSKRKPKCKRLALTSELTKSGQMPGHSLERPPFQYSLRRKKMPKLSPDPDSKDNFGTKFRFIQISAGKRKRCREKPMDWDHASRRSGTSKHRISRSGSSSGIGRSSRALLHSSALPDAHKNCLNMQCGSSDHLSEGSGTESESGLFTCDEGREADDEQSDWFSEPGGAVYGVPGVIGRSLGHYRGRRPHPSLFWWDGDPDEANSTVKSFSKENIEKGSPENQQMCRLRFQKLRERLLRREIRAGRRRIQDRQPGFSIISSVNQKVSRFLQDPARSELRLKPMSDRDRAQLWHLARLYSLHLQPCDDVPGGPILTKTQKTITTNHELGMGGSHESGLPGCSGAAPVGDLKRRRRSDNQSLTTEGSNDSLESLLNGSPAPGPSNRPPVPLASWNEEEGGADSLSERLADSEPDPVPSPTTLALQHCTL